MTNKPFLKWAGGKHKIAPIIAEHLPKNARRLVEPFAGSCAVALALDFEAYLLNDANADLIHLYQSLKNEKQAFVDYARSFFTSYNNTETRFYDLRNQFNHSANIVERAALFIYLNRHGYNGLCRYNSAGVFNVPFGRYKFPAFPETALQGFIQKSSRMEFLCGSFEAVFEHIEPTDAIYCDPPYVPLNDTASFTTYAKAGFSWENQQQLLHCIEDAAKKCLGVVVSNHDTDQVRDLYRSAQHMHALQVRRNIAAFSDSRKKVGELIACWQSVKKH